MEKSSVDADELDERTRYQLKAILQFLQEKELIESLVALESETGVKYVDGDLPVAGLLQSSLDMFGRSGASSGAAAELEDADAKAAEEALQAAPSLRAFNDSKKKEKGHDKGHRRNSRVIVMEDEPGGAAEKIERQRRMSNLRLPDNHPSMVPSSPPSPSPSGVHDGTPIGPSASGRPSELSQQSGGDVAPSPSREVKPKASLLEPPPTLGTPGPPPHEHSQTLTPVPVVPSSPSALPTSPSVAPSRRSSVVPKISLQSESLQPRNRWEYIKTEAVPTCRQINRSKAFLLVMFVALLFALFMPDLWILVDRSTNVDLDVLLTLVFLMFVFEFVVQCIAGRRTYVGSFFFYMDILGGVSLLLDVNYIGIQALIQSAGDVGNQVVIARAARIAKLGARVGRFTKMVKMLRFLPGMGGEKAAGSAKVINSRLTHSLSTRVSCLIILLVLLIPLFSMWSFPQTDQSLLSWAQRLDDISWARPEVLTRELEKFNAFYTNMNYFPYKVELREGVTLSNATSSILPWTSPERSGPSRADGVQVHQSDYLSISFNFTGPNQMDSGMNLLLLLFVMVLMVSFSMVLQKTTSKMILHPIEKLLTQMKDTAASIFESVPDLGGPGEEEEDSSDEENNEDGAWKDANFKEEIHLLDKVVQKVTDLQKKEDKTDSSAGQWVGARGTAEGDEPGKSKKGRLAGQGSLFAQGGAPPGDHEETDTMTMVQAQYQLLDSAGLSVDALNTWKISPLEFDQIMNRSAAGFIIGPANHGIRCERFVQGFVDEVELGYNKAIPYHNWFHAVDVAHATWRLANLCNVVDYFAYHETFAVLVAGLGHDLGHPGVNGRFLIETKHPLAMTYNDRSPLQHMSSAKLFEIAKKSHCAIFSVLSQNQYIAARKVCIQAILSTDTALHFQNVKKVQMLYEMNSEVLDHATEVFRESLEDEEEPNFPIPEVVEVFKEPSTKETLINLLVHVADSSNPTKPFRICKTWVKKAMEENFLQGDEEKLLGIPVQPLCDREKAKMAYGQIGFIEYLVAPFLLTVTKVLPPAENMFTQLMLNVKSWQKEWEVESAPQDSERLAMRSRLGELFRSYRENRIVWVPDVEKHDGCHLCPVQETLRVNLNARGDRVVSFAILALCVAPSGTMLAACTDKSRVIVLQARSNRQLRNLYGASVNEYDLPSVCFSLDGCFLYVSSSLPQPSSAPEAVKALCGQVAVFELKTAKLVLQLPCHEKAVRCFDRHPSEEWLVTGSFDKTALEERPWSSALERLGALLPSARREELVSLVRHALARAAPRELELLRAAEEMAALPFSSPTEEELLERLQRFEQFLRSLPGRPRLVTVARSVVDGFCPMRFLCRLETQLLEVLRRLYGSLEVVYSDELDAKELA
ncbi:5'-cyclic phosphodiesterase pde-4 [Durusdinium trenchii]|uniref:5'-cyclic phosphodiesterase pde-4 n=2 Tax=Durusdinium trenchii TaxID=1381693 RepID=A0ABP0KF37_9DINO